MQTQPLVSTRKVLADISMAVLLAAGVGLAIGAASLGLVCLLAAIGG
jgi:hypothetical protein